MVELKPVYKVYERWTVIKDIESDPKERGRRFLIKCECGFERNCVYTRLNKIKSCRRCSYFTENSSVKDYIGKKYGSWTVLHIAELDDRLIGVYVEAQCNCGRISEVDVSDLKDGKSKQCKSCLAFSNFHGKK